MQIKMFNIVNFRRLEKCKIELANNTTVFVGANNSGKTSAMYCLLKFLKYKNFNHKDITLSKWKEIESKSKEWEDDKFDFEKDMKFWRTNMPCLDIWIEVSLKEIQFVNELIPTLEWTGGLLGVRFSLEPKDINNFQKNYFNKRKTVKNLVESSSKNDGKFKLSPRNMYEYLSSNFMKEFGIKAYLLDPTCVTYENDTISIVKEQDASIYNITVDCKNIDNLIKVDSINAQRGFFDADDSKTEQSYSTQQRLSTQLRTYYNKHINPTSNPEASDIDALSALAEAKNVFEFKLKEGFSSAIGELEQLGYPGFSDPKIELTAKIDNIETLNHSSAVKFNLNKQGNDLPMISEEYNGLGYQNLISMLFMLIRFRDEWMRVGKEKLKEVDVDFIQPIHLILIEEPEAHLHAQVQQVFVKKAFNILRNNDALGQRNDFTSQLIISTHSSHIIHEMNFAALRYFKKTSSDVSYEATEVLNLSTLFAKENDAIKFAKRYLRLSHCDLFFADAVILVEGSAERLLVPNFILNHYPLLNERYISILEISGRYANMLKDLLILLDVYCLILTDLDTAESTGHHKSTYTERGKNYITTNPILTSWLPNKNKIDELLSLSEIEKINDTKKVRVSYQKEITYRIKDEEYTYLPRTFEDALIISNYTYFSSKELSDKNIMNILLGDQVELNEKLFQVIRKMKKVDFIFEVLLDQDPKDIVVPNYISEGLDWLEKIVKNNATSLTNEGEKHE